MPLSLKSIKSQFPIFTHRPELVYLDSAATTQKPGLVIKSIADFYEKENATVHRGLYDLSVGATKHYEGVRKKIADLIGATDAKTIAFTKGTTESINIVAQGFLKKNLKPGDRVVISAMEHHANFIPWQQICNQTGATLSLIPVSAQGELMTEGLDALLDRNTKMVALTHVSNVLGTINPVEEIIAMAHRKAIPVLVDGAQSVGHFRIDVKKWDVDFLAFSAHKMFGPMGIGILYCKEEYARRVDPFTYGGGAIKNVELEQTKFLDYPGNQEAGTPNVPAVIGLGAAIDFINDLDLADVKHRTGELTETFKDRVQSLNWVQRVGNPKNFGDIVAFDVENIHPHDVANFLANENIAVRAGHHCAQPLHNCLGMPSTVRASFSIYNTKADIDKTIDALIALKKFWS